MARHLYPQRRVRRGVLLLVVLSFLVLFVLVAVTFVIVASQYRKNALGAGKAFQEPDDYNLQLDGAAMQVFRGSPDPVSPILPVKSVLSGPISLLEKMYGNGAALGTLAAVNPNGVIASGQFIDLQLPAGSVPLPPPPVALDPYGAPAGYYNGCVLTMLTGPAAGLSTRIVGYLPGPPAIVRVMAFQGLATSQFASLTATAISAGTPQNFLINGRPFNGPGVGYNTATGKMDLALSTGTPLALVINYAALSNFPTGSTTDQALAFAAAGNVDYTAPDTQNPLLAYIPPGAPPSAMLPSLHRPDLVQYWITTSGASTWPGLVAANPGLCRAISMRPIGGAFPGSDHPNFTGSNPSPIFDPVNGPWDVDNDGDGITDSNWVDLGYPVRTTADGHVYKPLFAILCQDLDGRLNVNAHGSWAHVLPPATTAGPFAGGNSTPALPHGLGYGPAEVNLGLNLWAMQGQTGPGLLFGTNASGYPNLLGSRYGEPGLSLPLPGVTPTGAATPNPWLASPLGTLKYFEYPVPGSPGVESAFSTPPDMWANGFMGLDYRGMPFTLGLDGSVSPTTVIYSTQNSPYEFNLSSQAVRSSGGADSPFSAAELETILRIYDLDASQLPPRLLQLFTDPSTGQLVSPAAFLRASIATDTYDLPSPNIQGQTGSAPNYIAIRHLMDVALAKNSALTSTQLAQLFPPEVVAGLRMDINRPFGNGRDDNGNGVVDDPGEINTSNPSLSEMLLYDSNLPAALITPIPAPYSAIYSGVLFNHTGGLAVIDTTNGVYQAQDEFYARQLYARHLYVLMMLLKGTGSITYDGQGPTAAAETARAIAQWAVNVVDFRDRDSIMTPFKYNIDPFVSGWTANPVLSPDGSGVKVNLLANEGLVWGCERPELLLTEAVAWHDRRTEDLNTDSTGKYSDPTKNTNPDPDFDSQIQPRGAFFVELYNPWTTPTSAISANGSPAPAEVAGELYTASNGQIGVQLGLLSPSAHPSPVWRLVIVQDTATSKANPTSGERADPDYPQPLLPSDPTVERTIYMADPTQAQSAAGLPLVSAYGQAYYRSANVTIAGGTQLAPVLPGHYAVVGSSGIAAPANAGKPLTYTSPIGRLSTDTDNNLLPNILSTQRIELTPNVDPSVNQVQVFKASNVAIPPTAPQNIQPIVAVPIDQPRSVSISEPVNGYPTAAGAVPAGSIYQPPTSPLGDGMYQPPVGTPLDLTLNPAALYQQGTINVLMMNGTTPNFRTVHLQRLANPLADWDPAVNPYLTVDTMSVDLTAFNGATNTSVTPEYVGSQPLPPGAPNFASLERGNRASGASQWNVPMNLWSHQTPITVARGGGVDTSLTGSNYQYALLQTLGYLNSTFGAPMNATSSPAAPSAVYFGAPLQPFPWLTWNNRPFASAAELMLVPKSRSSRLLYDYAVSAPSSNLPLYLPTNVVLPPAVPPTGSSYPFNHLLSFFDRTTGTNGTNLYRALEYLQVPSRFVGTETFLNPQVFGNPNAPETTGLRPPFNKISNYRDPGRVNINTITEDIYGSGTSAVWTSLMNGSDTRPAVQLPTGGPWQPAVNTGQPGVPSFISLIASRRGYGAPTDGNQFSQNLVSPSPTCFANPVRSFGGAVLPLPGTPRFTIQQAGPPLAGPPLSEIDGTLMRAAYPDNSAPGPLFDMQSANPYNCSDLNPYFRFQTLERLSNVLTTRSNVYAVWITVGYFEVTPWTGNPATTAQVIDAAHPDGYQLGQELGSDTGNIKRHRAFYIFDRTIPVGFQRGQNTNVDRAILLKRFIE